MPVAVFVPTRIPGLWGGWQYQLSGLEASADAFNFGYGGYQEARGCVLFEQRALSAHPDARARWQGASLTTLAPFFLPAAYRSRPLLRPLCSLAAPSLPSSGIKNNHFYIENIFEELDAPGEWWFNRSSSELFFMPNGTLQNSTVVAVPVLETLIAINGTAESPAKVCANSGRRDSKRRRHRRVRSRPPSPPPSAAVPGHCVAERGFHRDEKHVSAAVRGLVGRRLGHPPRRRLFRGECRGHCSDGLHLQPGGHVLGIASPVLACPRHGTHTYAIL